MNPYVLVCTNSDIKIPKIAPRDIIEGINCKTGPEIPSSSMASSTINSYYTKSGVHERDHESHMLGIIGNNDMIATSLANTPKP